MLKAPTEDGELIGHRAHEMRKDMDDPKPWAACVTMGGKPQINKPGWEITEMWDNMFQAVAISTKYRFCGQGSTPSTALADAYKQMREFSKELKRHMEAT